MKTLILSAIAAATLATPTLAADVDAFFAGDRSGNELKQLVGNTSAGTEVAGEIFADLFDADDSANRGLDLQANDVRMSTKGAVNSTADAIFDSIAAENRNRD